MGRKGGENVEGIFIGGAAELAGKAAGVQSAASAFTFQLKETTLRTRILIAALIALPINAVLFGAGAVAVLPVPALAEQVKYLLTAVIILGSVATVPLAWFLAPRLRARHNYSRAQRNA